MEKLKLLKYAYHGALEIWARENDRLRKDPQNTITKIREEKANRELDEIREMLRKEEEKLR